jgi:hypothetical protein
MPTVAIAQLGERKTEGILVILRPGVRFTVATQYIFWLMTRAYFLIYAVHLRVCRCGAANS